MRRLGAIGVLVVLTVAMGCSKKEAAAPEIVRPGQATVGEAAATQPVPQLTAQSFESGDMKMADAPAMALELLLFDLRQRRDYDLSQHQGQPGPDSAYLGRWIDSISTELARRGYTTNSEGTLRRPNGGPIVDMR